VNRARHDFHAIRQAVRLTYGLTERADWVQCLDEGFEELGRRRACSPEALVGAAPSDELLAELVSHLTVPETYFFRHGGHFELCVNEIEDRLAKGLGRPPAVWSAGCASGEEIYTAAIVLYERLGLAGLHGVRLCGSDINREVIAKAQGGTYTTWSFRDAPPRLLNRYFEPVSTTGYRLASMIRAAVSFELGDTLRRAEAQASGSVDVLFFRNVAIYLEAAAVAATYAQFARVLSPGGLLFVAPADPRPAAELFESVAHETTSVYRRRAEPLEQQVEAPQRASDAAPPARKAPRRRQKQPKARPTPETVSPAVAAAAPSPASTAVLLGDRGDLVAAIAAASEWVANDPSSPGAYLLRAKLALAAGYYGTAAADLRSAVFLAPQHALARFWYVTALLNAGQPSAADTQLKVLQGLLARRRDTAHVEDEETTVAELREAARLLEERIR
jgi:chemotaxis protein methyltransferase CheR